MITVNQQVTLIKTFQVRKNAKLSSPAKLGATITNIFIQNDVKCREVVTRVSLSRKLTCTSHFSLIMIHSFNFLTQMKALSLRRLEKMATLKMTTRNLTFSCRQIK